MEVAGAVVGVISLGIQATQCLVQYYTSVKDQKTDTARTVSKLNRLLSILDSLDNNLKTRKFQPEERTLLKTIQSAIQECEEYICELGDEAKKLTEPAAPKRLTRTASSNIEAFARTAARRVIYPFRQSTLQKLDETVDEICAGLTLALQVVQQKKSVVIHDRVEVIHDSINDMKAVLELVRSTQIASATRAWLKAPDVAVNYREACRKRHPDTGLWFVKDGIEFTAWLSQPNSFLWLNGFAGCGKSVLSSTVIEWTERYRKRTNFGTVTSGLAFFYFTFNDESKQDASSMLRSIILQLANQTTAGEEHLIRLRDGYPDTVPPVEALLDTLNTLIEEFDDVYIILDALDESPKPKHRKTLLSTLDEIRGWSEPRLHLLVTSRDEQDIRQCLSPAEEEDVKMKNASIDSDIASFIAGHLQTNRLLRRWAKHHKDIQEALASRAGGVFRWVECQFTALESCPISKAHLRNLLASLPRSLDETYERMLLNISPECSADARRILTLLCTATRPLNSSELIEAIAVELGDSPRFDRDKILEGEDGVLYICPGLLEFDQDNNVRIAHYSVQEFLQSDRISKSRASEYYIESGSANTEVATVCLTYMLDPGVSQLVDILYSRARFQEEQEELSQIPFMFYAAKNWKTHYKAADKMNPSLHSLVVQLYASTEIAGSQTLFLSYVKSDHCIFTFPSPSAITSASENGFDLVVRELLDNYPNIDQSAKTLGAALREATMANHLPTVEVLLDHGADVDHEFELRTTSLYWALQREEMELARLLLNRGANPNRIFGESSRINLDEDSDEFDLSSWYMDENFDVKVVTPLIVAVWQGKEEFVELLLEWKADHSLGRPVEAAMYKNHQKIVQLFRERGIGVSQVLSAAECSLRSQAP